jgi:hypothetical protein
MERYGRFIFALLALIFMVCIVTQVFLAGMAVFVDQNWKPHTSFVRIFQFIPILMFAVSFIGRIPNRLRWSSFGLLIMIILQYVTAKAFSGIWVAAFHPVIAIFMFWNALTIVKQSFKWVKGKQNELKMG